MRIPEVGESTQLICSLPALLVLRRSGVLRHPWERMMRWYPGVSTGDTEFWKPIGLHPFPQAWDGDGKNLLSSKRVLLRGHFYKTSTQCVYVYI